MQPFDTHQRPDSFNRGRGDYKPDCCNMALGRVLRNKTLDGDEVNMKTAMERQLELELRANDYSHDRLMKQIQKRVESGNADELLEGRMILLHSIDALAAKLSEYFDAKLSNKAGQARTILAQEFYDSPRDLAYIILVTMVRNISQANMVAVTHLARALNKNIHDSILVRRLDRQDDTLSSYVDKRYAKRGVEWCKKEKLKIAYRQEDMGESTLSPLTMYLAAALIDLVIKSGINIIELKNVWKDGRLTKYVVYTNECYQMVLQSRDILLEDYRKYPILLVKPKDWIRFEGSGGYYNDGIYKLSMIKARPEARDIIKRHFETHGCDKLTKILNTLQATPWRVNRRVFEVMDHVFDNNIEDPNYPKHNPHLIGGLPYNGNMEPEDYVDPHQFGEVSRNENGKVWIEGGKNYRAYVKQLEYQRDICIANNGKALMHNLIMLNAREYLDEPEIYFSYQFDFRGRIYPIQQHLQPQGSGTIKALLEFARGSRVETDSQRDWFLIHGANTYGYDKLLYKDRITKILEHEQDILATADDPMQNRMFWNEADDPYMFLAWCFEYADYKRDPEGFESHIPIALDATCSGIQMYSGLLRDAEGGRAVNVVGETREDIYQNVADKVNEYLRTGDYPKEILYTDKTGKEHLLDTTAMADSFRGKVSRSLVKPNVMTVPYSVTTRGMEDQIKSGLTELEYSNRKFWVGDVWAAAKFLTPLNERAIAEIVTGAKVGQNYLKDVTRDLVNKGNYVAYRTPLTEFPVVQRIKRRKHIDVSTPVGRIQIRRSVDGLDKLKMSNGIAPNFIHSLDAALLATTVLKLADAGCEDFHMIHDSYGVPIGHIDNLNKYVRETFVELFEGHPLKRFVDTVNPSYEITPDQVMIDTLDLEAVLNSQYIFS